jgi:hypothetical protein
VTDLDFGTSYAEALVALRTGDCEGALGPLRTAAAVAARAAALLARAQRTYESSKRMAVGYEHLTAAATAAAAGQATVALAQVRAVPIGQLRDMLADVA